VLSDAAFASVLTSTFQARLLLPQLKPPVIDNVQANRDNAAQADAKQAQQNADTRDANVRRADARQAAIQAAAQRAIAASVISAPQASKEAIRTDRIVDRLSISSVSEIAQETLVNQVSPSGGVQTKQTAAINRPLTTYSASDLAIAKQAAKANVDVLLASTPVAVNVPPAKTQHRVAVQQYNRNAAPSSTKTTSSGVNIRA